MNNFLRPAVFLRTIHFAKQVASMSSSASPNNKIYELRTYSIKPSCMGEYLQLTKDKFHLRFAHSKATGFWISEIGGLNEVVHLWEYDSLGHRASVRAGLGADSVWVNEYLSKVVHFFDKQHNQLVTAEVLDTVPMHEGGVYLLCALALQTLGSPSTNIGASKMEELREVTAIQEEVLKEGQRGKLIALLRTQIGTQNVAYQLWNYRHVDDILKCKDFLESHPSIVGNQYPVLASMSSKLLIPVPKLSEPLV